MTDVANLKRIYSYCYCCHLNVGSFELQGQALLVIQSHDMKLQPAGPCGEKRCVHGTKALLFYFSIYMLALGGGGGIRGCVPALGADQFDDKNPEERTHLASFFNCFLFSITIGASIGVTIVVYMSTEIKWYKSFIIPLSCSAVGLVIIALGTPFQRTRVPGESPLIRVLEVLFLISLPCFPCYSSQYQYYFVHIRLFLQVLAVTVKNLSVKVPNNSDELYEIQRHESNLQRKLIPRTNQFMLDQNVAFILIFHNNFILKSRYIIAANSVNGIKSDPVHEALAQWGKEGYM